MQRKELALPEWVEGFLAQRPGVLPALEDRVRLAIELARVNVEQDTGGPFGAAVFERDSGRLVAVGVNRVVPCRCSVAHAEMMALMLAQEALQTFDLGAPGLPAHELVTSAQTCVMCFGATLWSGVRRVVYAATAADVEGLTGFDEGPLPADWQRQMERRGIAVLGGMLREEAREVLVRYRDLARIVYNTRREAGA